METHGEKEDYKMEQDEEISKEKATEEDEEISIKSIKR